MAGLFLICAIIPNVLAFILARRPLKRMRPNGRTFGGAPGAKRPLASHSLIVRKNRPIAIWIFFMEFRG